MKSKIIDFLYKNKSYYKEYFKKDRLNKIKYGYTSDINQIYYFLNIKDIKKSEYYKFFEISKKNFNLDDKNILEVASGYLPILSGIYSDLNINITAANIKFVLKKYKKVILKKINLKRKINLSSYDLVIGFRSCEITENVINQCFKYKKDFIFYLCPCNNKPLDKIKYNKENWSDKDWHNYLINKVKKNNCYKTIIIFKHTLPDNCPIIIGKYIK